jgi:hypothetical protein
MLKSAVVGLPVRGCVEVNRRQETPVQRRSREVRVGCEVLPTVKREVYLRSLLLLIAGSSQERGQAWDVTDEQARLW